MILQFISRKLYGLSSRVDNWSYFLDVWVDHRDLSFEEAMGIDEAVAHEWYHKTPMRFAEHFMYDVRTTTLKSLT